MTWEGMFSAGQRPVLQGRWAGLRFAVWGAVGLALEKGLGLRSSFSSSASFWGSSCSPCCRWPCRRRSSRRCPWPSCPRSSGRQRGRGVGAGRVLLAGLELTEALAVSGLRRRLAVVGARQRGQSRAAQSQKAQRGCFKTPT